MPSDNNPCRVVVLISGNGSNLQAIIDNTSNDPLINIVGVISNRPQAFGLQRAELASIPTAIVDHTLFSNPADFEQALINKIEAYQPTLIVLAGFMRILSSTFVSHFEGRILNIHPALLPNYKGLHTHQRVLASGDKEHGASVHFVTQELDGGPIVAQVKVAVLANDDEKSLSERVLTAEHWLYSQVISLFAQNRLKVEQNIVTLDGKHLAEQGLQLSLPTAQGIVS
ncbi:MAG: phosphoribosylglycinamide formyltransferase [Gammaproteobacteria bacterium]|jgi:phosphoribosylglycinamide formyltransferase-1|nr:phosphoribosylglycinamide formyltransferase [Gammaproteobacteria bacterium]